jgi:hypothetical protein
MTVREAIYTDIPAIARVHVDAWRSTYKGIFSDEYLANLSYEKRERAWYEILLVGDWNVQLILYIKVS